MLHLVNNAGNGLVAGSITPGVAATLSNAQCTIGNAGTVTTSGNNLTLPVNFNFAARFTGSKSVFGYVDNNESQNNGWTNLGAWIGH